MSNCYKYVVTLILLALAATATGADSGSLKIDNSIIVDGQQLVLNGSGIRKKFGLVKVYIAALYRPTRQSNEQEVLASHEQQRMLLIMQRDIDANTILSSFHDALKDNLDAPAYSDLQSAIAKLDRIFTGLQPHENDRIALDMLADGSVKISSNDKPAGVVPGPDIAAALLKIWLGKSPVQADLKQQLLGR